jgi:hypothetical protein
MTNMKLKMHVYWTVATCSLVDTDHVSEELTASIIIILKMEAPLKHWSSTRLRGATTQKRVIFILTAIRTSELTNMKLYIEYTYINQKHFIFCNIIYRVFPKKNRSSFNYIQLPNYIANITVFGVSEFSSLGIMYCPWRKSSVGCAQ